MKGTLLEFSVQQNSGVIAAENGSRFSFPGAEWRGSQLPYPGLHVDFQEAGGTAVSVHPDLSAVDMPPMLPVHSQPQKTDRTTAGLLAILLGALGIHKFLMGYQQQGIIMISISLGAGVLTCGIASIVIHIIAIIEGIIYFCMSDEEFNRTYITGRKTWF